MSDRTAPKRNVFSKVSPSAWVGVALAVLAVIFVVQNNGSATIDIFWISVRAPLWFTLLAVFLVGWLVGFLTMRKRVKTT
jgi:uncharacterized integral membrane protein